MAALGSRAATSVPRHNTTYARTGKVAHGERISRIRVRAAAASAAPVVPTTDVSARQLLSTVQIRRAADGQTVDAASIVPTTGRCVVPFLTQFADFDSWELAQKLVWHLRGKATLPQFFENATWPSARLLGLCRVWAYGRWDLNLGCRS